jgi:hypothetical protein
VFLVLAPWWPSQESDRTEIWNVDYSYQVAHIIRYKVLGKKLSVGFPKWPPGSISVLNWMKSFKDLKEPFHFNFHDSLELPSAPNRVKRQAGYIQHSTFITYLFLLQLDLR